MKGKPSTSIFKKNATEINLTFNMTLSMKQRIYHQQLKNANKIPKKKTFSFIFCSARLTFQRIFQRMPTYVFSVFFHRLTKAVVW